MLERGLLAVIVAVIVATTCGQLFEPASPAHTVCAQVARSGASCVVEPIALDAQVITVDNGVSKANVLILSRDGEVVGVMPLD